MTLQNTIIHLIAFPGVGKLTIAKEICRQGGCFLLDNHAFNNLIFPFAIKDEKAEISDKTWDYVHRIRGLVLDAVVDLASPDASFVLTNAFTKNDPDTHGWIESAETVAGKRGALFLPVRLLCDPEEHRKRITSQGREEVFKVSSDHALDDWHARDEVYAPNHPNTITLDITHLAPEAAAEKILEQAVALSLRNAPKPALEVFKL